MSSAAVRIVGSRAEEACRAVGVACSSVIAEMAQCSLDFMQLAHQGIVTAEQVGLTD